MTARYEGKKAIEGVQVGDLVRINDTCWEPNKVYLEGRGVPQVFPVVGLSGRSSLEAATTDN